MEAFGLSDDLSAVGRLLQEVSYESAKSYHDGGMGRENVLTVEVFQALDFLPREAFLGSVVGAAHGAVQARERLIESIGNCTVGILVGDISPTLASGGKAAWSIQPDAVIESDPVVCLVEAKRLRTTRFHPQQLARCLQTVMDPKIDKLGFVLLVLGDDPPIPVAGHGRVDLCAAVGIGLDLQDVSWEHEQLTELVHTRIAWIIWREIVECVESALANQQDGDESAHAALARLVTSVSESVRRHS